MGDRLHPVVENERRHCTCLGRRRHMAVDASEVRHYTAGVRFPTDAEVPTDLLDWDVVPIPLGSHQEVAVHQEDRPPDRLEFSEVVSPLVFHHRDDLESVSAEVDLSHTPHHSQDDRASSVVHLFVDTCLPVEVGKRVHPKNVEEADHHHIDHAAIPPCCSLIEGP